MLNMLTPRPARGLGGHGGGPNVGECKPKALGVAAEHLGSSAMRMLWPVDKKKMDQSSAAATCRDAASLLQDAAAHLAQMAESLEGGGAAAAKPTTILKIKRRRTVTGLGAAQPGSSPRGPSSSPKDPRPTQRTSPPVRFSGLRV